VARFEGRVSHVFKEPVEAPNSNLTTFLRDYEPFWSKIFIAHVRRATHGAIALKHTHPFSRTFRCRDVVSPITATCARSLSGAP